MGPHHTLLRLLIACGPPLYVGLFMAVDPASFVRALEALARVIEAMSAGILNRPPVPVRFSACVPAVRSAGVALIVCAMLPFIAS